MTRRDVTALAMYFAGAMAYAAGGWLHVVVDLLISYAIIYIAWPYYARWAVRHGIRTEP